MGYRAHDAAAAPGRAGQPDRAARTLTTWSICEGAGSPAEINLRDDRHRQHGPGPARRACRWSWSATSTAAGCSPRCSARWRCSTPDDQALIAGFVVNKFRGDPALLRPRPGHAARSSPAARRSACCRGRPASGSTPRTPSSLDAGAARRRAAAARRRGSSAGRGGPAARGSPTSPTSTRWPPSPASLVRFATSPAELADADLVVLPGTRATVADLAWLRDRGLADAIPAGPAAGRPVLGICGGYQMLGRPDRRRRSSRAAARSTGSACCRCGSRSRRRRSSAARAGRALGEPVPATRSTTASPRSPTRPPSRFLDGCRGGAVWGTTGTAPWRTTGSGGRSWPRWRRWPAGTSRPRPTPASPPSGRPARRARRPGGRATSTPPR